MEISMVSPEPPTRPAAGAGAAAHSLTTAEMVLGDLDAEMVLLYSCLVGNASLDDWRQVLGGGAHWAMGYRTVYFGKAASPTRMVVRIKAGPTAPAWQHWIMAEYDLRFGNPQALRSKVYWAHPRALGHKKSRNEPVPSADIGWLQKFPDYERFTEQNDIYPKSTRFQSDGSYVTTE